MSDAEGALGRPGSSLDGGHGRYAMLRALLDSHAGTLAELFYAVLLQDTEARRFLSASVVEGHLKPSLAEWLRKLLPDPDEDDTSAFEARQHAIGEIHARIKIPTHLVMAGGVLLQNRIAELLREAGISWEDRFDSLRFVSARIQRAILLMSRSYASSVENRVRLDEAYRLFSLDQDINLERESQRASLMDWAQSTLFQILDPAGMHELRTLAKAPFGLWLRHRAGVMFNQSPALQAIIRIMERIDQDLLPRLGERGQNDHADALKALRAAVDEMAFLLSEMFQGLSDMESGRDALTRALNRRFLPSILTREINFADKHGATLSLLLLDIDHFKRINDAHGHQAGDLILRQAAEVVMENVRPSDFLFRYGGEEFLVVLVETDIQQAQIIGERIRQAFMARGFHLGEQALQVTTSIGIAQHAGHPDPEYLIKLADEALYRAKAAGRNRIELA